MTRIPYMDAPTRRRPTTDRRHRKRARPVATRSRRCRQAATDGAAREPSTTNRHISRSAVRHLIVALVRSHRQLEITLRASEARLVPYLRAKSQKCRYTTLVSPNNRLNVPTLSRQFSFSTGYTVLLHLAQGGFMMTC